VLGNTRSVCRKSYIHPAILDAYESGMMARAGVKRPNRRQAGLRLDEVRTLALLRQCERQPLSTKAA